MLAKCVRNTELCNKAITSANTHDVTVAIDTVDSIIIKRPSSKSITIYRNKNKNWL
jgi:hypothetical protein